MNHDDIEHSKPKGDKYQHIKTRENNMNTKDIPGAQSRVRHQSRRNSNGYDGLNYNDVSNSLTRTNRVSNPLDPIYDVIGEDGKKY